MTTDPKIETTQPVGSGDLLAGRCECILCKRGREYYRITERLPEDEKKWMRDFYDSVLDTETELSMEKAS